MGELAPQERSVPAIVLDHEQANEQPAGDGASASETQTRPWREAKGIAAQSAAKGGKVTASSNIARAASARRYGVSAYAQSRGPGRAFSFRH